MARGQASGYSGVDLPTLLVQTGLSQTELAEKVGCSQGAVSKWIHRRRTPGAEWWDAIAATCGISRADVAVAVSNTVPTRSPSPAGEEDDDLRDLVSSVARMVEDLTERVAALEAQAASAGPGGAAGGGRH